MDDTIEKPKCDYCGKKGIKTKFVFREDRKFCSMRCLFHDEGFEKAKSELAEKDKEIQMLHGTINNLEIWMNERDGKIAGLERKYGESITERMKLMNDLIGRDKDISALTTKETQMVSLQKELKVLSEERDELKAEIKDIKSAITEFIKDKEVDIEGWQATFEEYLDRKEFLKLMETINQPADIPFEPMEVPRAAYDLHELKSSIRAVIGKIEKRIENDEYDFNELEILDDLKKIIGDEK